MGIQVEVAGRSDVGCVRPNNEDNFGYDARYGVFVVCDGMGGNAAGEVASKIAVDTVLAYFRQQGGASSGAERVRSAIHGANQAILQAGRADQSREGMGSTIAVVHIPEPGAAWIGHVGDTRVYRIREGAIELLTNDHSLVMDQVKKGLLTAEQAQRSAIQNVLLQALGTERVEPDIAEVAVSDGDLILLASDGITRQVPDEKILESLKGAAGLRAGCSALIQAARKAGGEDNATCLLLSFQRRSWLQSTFGGGRRKWQNSI